MYLEYKNPQKNQYRFYRITANRSLFGKVMLTRQWGRIGSHNPRTINHEVSDVAELIALVNEILKVRHRHHYQVIRKKLTVPDPGQAANDPVVLVAQQTKDRIQLAITPNQM